MILTTLKQDLERTGFRVRLNQDRLSVLLPLMSSLRIRLEDDRAVIEARFGNLGRLAATWVDFGMAFVLLLLAIIPLPVPGVGFFLTGCAILTVLWDVCRYMITESAAATVRAAVLNLR